MADKGIRQYARRRFLELLPTRVNDRNGNIKFRGTINSELMEQFGITLASAATHYNDAKHNAALLAKTDETIAKLLEGLGRPPEKNNGGRKKKVVETPATNGARTPEELTPEGGEQTVFTVCKKKDNSVVAEGLSFEEAKAMVEANNAPFKPRLYWK